MTLGHIAAFPKQFRYSLLAILLGCLALFVPKAATGRVRPATRHVMVMKATAFARVGHRTASGTWAREGIVAADPAILPLGTRIRIVGSEGYDGNYLVSDTGAAVKGRHIDVCVESRAEAKRFGVKRVRVIVQKTGAGPADARLEEQASLLDPVTPASSSASTRRTAVP